MNRNFSNLKPNDNILFEGRHEGRFFSYPGTIVDINESQDTCTMILPDGTIEEHVPLSNIKLNEAWYSNLWNKGKEIAKGLVMQMRNVGGKVAAFVNGTFVQANSIINIIVNSQRGTLNPAIVVIPAESTIQEAKEVGISISSVDIDSIEDPEDPEFIDELEILWGRAIQLYIDLNEGLNESYSRGNRKITMLEAMNQSKRELYEQYRLEGDISESSYQRMIKELRLIESEYIASPGRFKPGVLYDMKMRALNEAAGDAPGEKKPRPGRANYIVTGGTDATDEYLNADDDSGLGNYSAQFIKEQILMQIYNRYNIENDVYNAQDAVAKNPASRLKISPTRGLIPIMIMGAPAIGKTTIVKDVLKHVQNNSNIGGGKPGTLISLDAARLYKDDFTLPDLDNPVKLQYDTGEKDEDGNPIMQDFEIKQAIDVTKSWLPMYRMTGNPERDRVANEYINSKFNTWGGIIFLDEITRISTSVMNILMTFVQDRTIGDAKLGSQWTIVAAGNRKKDMPDMAFEWDSAWNGRFQILNFTPTFNDWIKWAVDAKVDGNIINFLRSAPELWYEVTNATMKQKGEDDMSKSGDPRGWAAVSDAIKAMIVAKGNPKYGIKGAAELFGDKTFASRNVDIQKEYVDALTLNVGTAAAREYVDKYLNVLKDFTDEDAKLVWTNPKKLEGNMKFSRDAISMKVIAQTILKNKPVGGLLDGDGNALDNVEVSKSGRISLTDVHHTHYDNYITFLIMLENPSLANLVRRTVNVALQASRLGQYLKNCETEYDNNGVPHTILPSAEWVKNSRLSKAEADNYGKIARSLDRWDAHVLEYNYDPYEDEEMFDNEGSTSNAFIEDPDHDTEVLQNFMEITDDGFEDVTPSHNYLSGNKDNRSQYVNIQQVNSRQR